MVGWGGGEGWLVWWDIGGCWGGRGEEGCWWGGVVDQSEALFDRDIASPRVEMRLMKILKSQLATKFNIQNEYKADLSKFDCVLFPHRCDFSAAKYTGVHACIYMCKDRYAYTSIHIYTHVHVYVHIYTHIHKHIDQEHLKTQLDIEIANFKKKKL